MFCNILIGAFHLLIESPSSQSIPIFQNTKAYIDNTHAHIQMKFETLLERVSFHKLDWKKRNEVNFHEKSARIICAKFVLYVTCCLHLTLLIICILYFILSNKNTWINFVHGFISLPYSKKNLEKGGYSQKNQGGNLKPWINNGISASRICRSFILHFFEDFQKKRLVLIYILNNIRLKTSFFTSILIPNLFCK